MEAAGTVPLHIEARLQPRQIAQTCKLRRRRAHAGVGDEIEMLARFGNIVHHNGNLPRRGRQFLGIGFRHDR